MSSVNFTVTGPSYGQLVETVEAAPLRTIHAASSFSPEDLVSGKLDWTAPFPTHRTGIRQVDQLMLRSNAVADAATSSMVSVTQGALNGALYGALGGLVIGAISWGLIRWSKGVGAMWVTGLTLGCALIGSLIKTAKELRGATRQFQQLVFH